MSDILQIEDSKWYHVARTDTFICCDCSLVHKMTFKIKDGKIYAKWVRDDRATAGYRKGREVKKVLKTIAKKL